MATRYWVGGTGNWSDAANHWSDSSGGSPGAGFLPTSNDNVIFDAGSNVGTGAFTVTVDGTTSSPSLCADFSTGGAGGALDGAMTLSWGATSDMNCYGSMTLPATNFTSSGTAGAVLRFKATTTGKTITTNGTSLGTVNQIYDGVGGGWTLGGNFTASGAASFRNGSFSTANYNLTVNAFSDFSGTASLNLGSSTVTLNSSSPINFTNPNFSLTAGTSTITCSAASPTFSGGGQTFYNVTFSSAASGTTTINGANTFNNLTQTSRSATGQRIVSLSADQTVSGTLTLGAANTAIRRLLVISSAVGTRRTITLNGTLATLADVDFRDIGAAGSVATPWTGTRLGDGLNNNNITFDAPKTVYWNLSGSQNWSATGWATTNNGVPAVNNFPLGQDTAVFTEAGSAETITFDASWWVGSIQMADGVSNRTTAFTLATATTTPSIFGNVTLFANLTLSGTGTINFNGQGTTQTITSAGISWTQSLTVNAPSSTFKLADNLTNTGTSFTLTSGTLDLNNKVLTCVAFLSSNSNTRSIAFGTGKIVITGNAATVLAMAIADNFTYTGTPLIECSYAGATGTRTVQFGSTSGATESNVPSISITAGTDTIAMGSLWKNVNFTGFAGTLNANTRTIYGNLTISSGMTLAAGSSTTTFAATSGTQNITTATKTFDFPLTFNGVGGTWAFQDALTQGSTRAFTITNGTVKLKTGATTTVGAFATTGTNQKYLQSTTAGSQATLSQASGTVTVSYLSIKDIAATGGATWNAYVDYNNVDQGDNTGWDFSYSPAIDIEFPVALRSFTQPKRF